MHAPFRFEYLPTDSTIHPMEDNKKAAMKNQVPTCMKRNVNANPGPKSVNSSMFTERMDASLPQQDDFGFPVIGSLAIVPSSFMMKPKGWSVSSLRSGRVFK